MKVFGVGLNKTGTSTLGACLRGLGFRHIGFNMELTRCFASGDIESILSAAEEYDAFEDWPWPLVFTQLDDRFPNSKFVLSVRKDARTWLESVKKHARRSGPTEARRIAYGYESPFGHEDEHLAVYESHNAKVRHYFADRENDLLEVCWETGDGWEELCDFLQLEVPGVALPHVNKAPWLSYLPIEKLLPFWRQTRSR